MDRRRFLKYAGATAAVVGASALGLNQHLRTPSNATTVATLSSSINYVSLPPNPLLKVKPQYIQPTTADDITLSLQQQYDPNNSLLRALQTTWFIDNTQVKVGPNFSHTTRLSEGQHNVKATISNGRDSRSLETTILVEPDQLPDPAYQPKPLNMKYKGVRYYAGLVAQEWKGLPEPSNEEMDEQLDTIHNDLGCNAIIVVGGEPSEDRMIQCAVMAIDKGFEKIYVQPSYLSMTVDETIDKIGKFAPKVKSLRDRSPAVTYMVSHELSIETAITPGATQVERWKNQTSQNFYMVKDVLPSMFKRIIEVCKANYGYPIAYAANQAEANNNLVPWSDPSFESVGVDAYIVDSKGWDEKFMINLLNSLKQYRKPVYDFDFGMNSYANADTYGGGSPLYTGNNPYDDEPQARFTVRMLNMLNQAGIDGCFWVRYNDTGRFDRGPALYRPTTLQRKKGFYMYKSYQRAS